MQEFRDPGERGQPLPDAALHEQGRSPGGVTRDVGVVQLGQSDLVVSRVALGCMQLGGSWDPQQPLQTESQTAAVKIVRAAVDAGITFFDHADIYCHGKSEEVFGRALAELGSARQSIVIQTKCGIVLPDSPLGRGVKYYDSSYDHITASVEASLRRLGTDYLDVLLLHRPDPLLEPEQVARAFDELRRSGKVRWFGVSNYGPMQMAFLQRFIDVPLVTNQLQLSVAHPYLLSEDLHFNVAGSGDARSPQGLFEFCRLHNITIQAWSPLGGGRLTRRQSEKDPIAESVLETIAKEHGVSEAAIALAWLHSHPAGIIPVVSSRAPERVTEAAGSWKLRLSRVEWYRLLASSVGELP